MGADEGISAVLRARGASRTHHPRSWAEQTAFCPDGRSGSPVNLFREGLSAAMHLARRRGGSVGLEGLGLRRQVRAEIRTGPTAVKFTQYFIHMRQRSDRAGVKLIWIQEAIEHPIRTEVQSDGRIKKWARVKELNRILRVVLLEDGETVHNAFFDRSFKEE